MFIFETENRIKLSSHNTGQIQCKSLSVSCLKNQSLALFWRLHEKNRLEFSLRDYIVYFSWWPLLTAIPKQLTKHPIFWLPNRSCSHKVAFFKQRNRELTFVLELDHDTLTGTVWYQIDQCHFGYTTESLVPYLELYGLLIQTRIFSTSYRLQVNGRKAFH